MTGERVHVSRLADGRPAVVVEPLEGGEGAAYLRFQRGDDLYVVPSYVVELIPERLDLELFNVTELVEQGFTDEAADELPTILTYRQGERVEVPSLRPVRRLGSIGADAARQTRRGAGTGPCWPPRRGATAQSTHWPGSTRSGWTAE